MHSRSRTLLFLFPVAVAGVMLATTSPASAGVAPSHDSDHLGAARVHFVKHLTDPTTFTFQGRTTGAACGKLVSQLLGDTAPETPQYRFVSFRWTVTAHRHSFVAETQGTLDKTTGVVLMSGTVVSGWHKGASVIESGQLTDPATYSFEGDLVILTGD